MAPSDLWTNDLVHCGETDVPDDRLPEALERARGDSGAGPSARALPLGDLGSTYPTTSHGTVIVAGDRARSGPGELLTFRAEVEDGLEVDPLCFALTVERILWDPRSWGGTGAVSFARVDGEAYDFRIILASPQRTRRLCLPLRTGLTLSCKRHDRVVINAWRWQEGADTFGVDLESYRRYLINHEVGHILGHGHRSCPDAGSAAPVMMQQTKDVGACRSNVWLLPSERSR